MPHDIATIIVNYNGRELLDDCIASVLERPDDGLSVEIVVVDNASSDGSVEYLRARYPSVRTIACDENKGFAAGNNVGIGESDSRHVLLLNSDARLCNDALRVMFDALEADPSIGQLGPRLLNPDGTLQKSARGFPTVWRLATEFLYLRKLAPRSRVFNAFYMGGFDFDRELDVDFLMGACLLVRRSAIDEVGPMNEDYFMFSEETDWAKRFWDRQWKVRFIPTAETIHLGGQSWHKEYARMYTAQVAGNLRFLALHESVGTARRAKRLLRWALRMRAVVYGFFSLIPLGNRSARRRRSQLFAEAARHVAGIDVGQLLVPERRDAT